MFTLIALGVGAAWVYSTVAILAPGIFPAAMRPHGMVDVYFEAAAVIVVLVLLGQVLELRARARTSGAIRALLNLSPPTALRLTADGDQAFTFVEDFSGASGEAVLRFDADRGNTQLLLDVDGDGRSDMRIVLVGGDYEDFSGFVA